MSVPAGFITDFGSIPRPLWGVRGLAPSGRYRRAYVVHDALYAIPVVRHGSPDAEHPLGHRICRETADAVLREALGVLGASWAIRMGIWSAVRAAGWRPWRVHRQREGA